MIFSQFLLIVWGVESDILWDTERWAGRYYTFGPIVFIDVCITPFASVSFFVIYTQLLGISYLMALSLWHLFSAGFVLRLIKRISTSNFTRSNLIASCECGEVHAKVFFHLVVFLSSFFRSMRFCLIMLDVSIPIHVCVWN